MSTAASLAVSNATLDAEEGRVCAMLFSGAVNARDIARARP